MTSGGECNTLGDNLWELAKSKKAKLSTTLKSKGRRKPAQASQNTGSEEVYSKMYRSKVCPFSCEVKKMSKTDCLNGLIKTKLNSTTSLPTPVFSSFGKAASVHRPTWDTIAPWQNSANHRLVAATSTFCFHDLTILYHSYHYHSITHTCIDLYIQLYRYVLIIKYIIISCAVVECFAVIHESIYAQK